MQIMIQIVFVYGITGISPEEYKYNNCLLPDISRPTYGMERVCCVVVRSPVREPECYPHPSFDDIGVGL